MKYRFYKRFIAIVYFDVGVNVIGLPESIKHLTYQTHLISNAIPHRSNIIKTQIRYTYEKSNYSLNS